MPANLADTLQEIRDELRGLNTSVRTGRAETANALVRLRNRLIDPMVLSPVQKIVRRDIINCFLWLISFFIARCQALVSN
jgi:hypothetical protein